MQLFFIGTGSAFNPTLGNTSAYFMRGADLYLIDCGATLFNDLIQRRFIKTLSGSITVVLTHMHADHCGSLGTLALYAAEVLGRPITVVHPNEQVRTLLSLMGVAENQYRLVPSLSERGIAATPRPVQHVSTIPAYAYLLEDEEETIYYSGDAREIPGDILESLRTGRIARVYQDAAYLPGGTPPGFAHMSLSALADLVEPALRSKFTLMHFNTDFAAEAFHEGFTCAEIDRYFHCR